MNTRAFLSAAGNTYFGHGATVYKATGTPSSFSSTAVSITGVVLDAVQVSDVLHILSRSSTPGSFFYSTFDMATDALVITNESVYTAGVSSSTGGNIGVRSDGTVVAIFRGADFSSMGNGFSRLYYRIRSTGGTWGTATGFFDGSNDTTAINPFAIMPGTSGRLHFLYRNGIADGDTRHRTLLSSDTLGTDTNWAHWVFANSWPYDYVGTSGGVSPIPIGEKHFASSNNRPATADVTSADVMTTGAITDISLTEIVGFAGPSMSYDGTTRRIIYGENANTLLYRTNSGGGWSAPTTLRTNSTQIPRTYSLNRFTRSGSERLAYFTSDDSLNLMYGEVELSAGGGGSTRPIAQTRTGMTTAVCRGSSF